MLVRGPAGKFDIKAGMEGHRGGMGKVRGDLMVIIQLGRSFIVSYHQTIKAPFPFKQVCKQSTGASTGFPINIMIGRHDRSRMGGFHHHLKGQTEDIEHLSHSHMDRGMVSSPFAIRMSDKMLEGCYGHTIFPLQSLHIGNAHASYKIRVFSICLFCPSPPGIPGNIEYWGQALVHTQGGQLPPDGTPYAFHKVNIPR